MMHKMLRDSATHAIFARAILIKIHFDRQRVNAYGMRKKPPARSVSRRKKAS
jgi:hypothetical protein